jgi:hypothetical protein
LSPDLWRTILRGKKLHEQIDEAIRVYDKLMFILPAHSMNSEWVKTELATEQQRDIAENKRLLFLFIW